ncbi:DUF3298 domain-containing protein [Dysgonomonas sp. Marseille-P4677]|uniref:DUF3298 and DUF4163 domain-containing protein n=1 Tax=Dysgonomonas sp. Marseille-P4677 TaxID=2364790 RepID=UPI001913D492|nr:DUF3298 and DUF4163 domain-containing protein [Dysgonomonas sp. Marseille-P4677]MBK5721911.1 DUF3298 domain-containing protein [Dysgonomonas sp. Marseille-P4677]
MRKIFYLLLLTILVAACNNFKKQPEKSSDLSFSKAEYKKESSLPTKEGTKLTAIIPVASGDNEIAKSINDSIFKTVKLIIGQNDDVATTYDDLFDGFIKNYEAFVSDNSDYNLMWEADINGVIEYYNSDIVNIRLTSYSMTGGAHGNPNTTSLFFSPKDGKSLTINNIIKDIDRFSKLAEMKFREKYNLSANQSINSTKFMFPDDIFILPQNIFITKDGLLLYYNVYEIAAYADGPQELLIPYSIIKDNLLINIQ